MSLAIRKVAQIEGLIAKAKVTRRKHVHLQWFKRSDKDPLSDIELAATFKQQGTLNVLLNDSIRVLMTMMQHFGKGTHALDAATLRAGSWLYDPHIGGAMRTHLRPL
jgi:hypothetical protein